jgi:hypothetical protein
MKTLERKPILHDDIDPIVEQAKTSLGYNFPGRSRELEDALAKIGVQPFTARTVERYKLKKRVSQRDGIGTAIFFCITFGIGFGVMAIGFTIGWACAAAEFKIENIASLYAVSAGLFLTSTGLMIFAMSHGPQAEWVKIAISEYKKPVPEFALQTAVNLNAICPRVSLSVEEMQKTEDKDPFLVASLDGASYYLEVWNEPGFKQERVA